jgi:1,4-dihydroxy-2-naphthoate octaprenyltransferase
MTRPSQLALIGLIFANGVLLGLWRGASTTAGLGAIAAALLLVLLAAASVHLANEAADHDTDRLTQRTPFSGGSGALAASGLAPRVPLTLGLGLATLVVGSSLAAVTAGLLNPLAAVLLLAGLGGGLAYSLPPAALMRRGWGEPLNAALGAMLLPLCGVATVSGAITVDDVIAFLPLLSVTFASVLTTAWPDRAADAATDKATLQVRLAPSTLRRLHLGATVAFVVGTLLASAIGAMPLALAGLLVMPALMVGVARYTRQRVLSANVVAMVGLALVTTVSLAIALLSERA